MREWYEACDECGIHPEERVNRWINMHNFLISDMTFTDFPPPTTHAKGIPIITFEALLQGISIRILLYGLSLGATFNNCAISTLGIESLFSTLSKADFTLTGCPKATQIHQIIPIMMDYNTHKHNPDKIFKMDGRKGAPYPYYDMDKVINSTSNEDVNAVAKAVQFKAHNFDKYVKCNKKRFKFNTNIDGLNTTQRGRQTVTGDFYKLDMSKLTGLDLLGLLHDRNI